MGRNAKLRQQRKPIPSAVTANSQKNTTSEKPQAKSLWGKLTSLFKASPETQALYEATLNMEEFFDQKKVVVAATAWEGYQKQGRGVVWVQELEEKYDIEYVPRHTFKKKMQQLGTEAEEIQAAANLIEVYTPQTGLVLAFVDKQGERTVMSYPTIEPAPPECYQIQQAQV